MAEVLAHDRYYAHLFRAVPARERRQADLFYADLLGRPLGPRSSLLPPTEAEEGTWSEAVAMLPEPYQVAYGLAQDAEAELDAETVDALTFDLLEVEDQAGLDEFVKKLARTVKRAARDVGARSWRGPWVKPLPASARG